MYVRLYISSLFTAHPCLCRICAARLVLGRGAVVVGSNAAISAGVVRGSQFCIGAGARAFAASARLIALYGLSALDGKASGHDGHDELKRHGEKLP